MHRRIGIVLLALMISISGVFTPTNSHASATANNDPIIFVHGFGGWGRDEVLGFKYWGGFIDLQQDLRNQGHTTYTAAVGPFSSNWDRGVELYYQIKGGRVDYGAAHAAQHGHERYGRTYSGFYPEWGTIDPATQQIRKVHIISHSQGGQTSRVFAHLLGEGAAAERAITPIQDVSPLFAGGHSWVRSVTTISSPHDGTTLVAGVNTFLPFAQQMIALIAGTAGSNTSMQLYDFKLDQWGLQRRAGESFNSYSDRVWNSSLWVDTKDISAWELSPEGAKELNSWVRAQPDVYYFSWSTEKTYASWLTGHHIPEITINPIWTANAWYLGSYTTSKAGKVRIDSSWWRNDGVVNTNSMSGPHNGSSDVIIEYNGSPQIGRWNHMGTKWSYDHSDIIGITIYYDIRSFYRSHAQLLKGLN